MIDLPVLPNFDLIKYQDKPVTTYQGIADCFEQANDTIRIQFNENKEEFIEETDYFLIKGEELAKLKEVYKPKEKNIEEKELSDVDASKIKREFSIGSNAPSLMLFTTSGLLTLSYISTSKPARKIAKSMVRIMDAYLNNDLGLPSTKTRMVVPNQELVPVVIANPSVLPSDTLVSYGKILAWFVKKDLHRDVDRRRRENIDNLDRLLFDSGCVIVTVNLFDKFLITDKGVRYGFVYLADKFNCYELAAPLGVWNQICRGE